MSFPDRMIFNLMGTRFEVSTKTYEQLKQLSDESKFLIEEAQKSSSRNDVFLERDPACFSALLQYCCHKELHLPTVVCPQVFKDEMKCWGVEMSQLSNCCFNTMVSFLDDRLVVDKFESGFMPVKEEGHAIAMTPWQCFRVRAWSILDKPGSSILAKIYFVVFLVFLLLSLFSMIASTDPAFKRDLDTAEWKNLLGNTYESHKRFLQRHFGSGKKDSTTPHTINKRSVDGYDMGTDNGGVMWMEEAQVLGGLTEESETVPEKAASVDHKQKIIPTSAYEFIQSFQNLPEYWQGKTRSGELFLQQTLTRTSPEQASRGTEPEFKSRFRKKREVSRVKRKAPPSAQSPTQATASTQTNGVTPDSSTFATTLNSFIDDDLYEDLEIENVDSYQARMNFLDYVDYACLAFFTLDFVLRLMFCPRLTRFFCSVLNLSDLIALLAGYGMLVVNQVLPREKYTESDLDLIECLQIFRFLRFFRLLRDVIGFRVLVHSVKASGYELLLLVMFLSSGVLLFSTVVYWCERSNMGSIPNAFWWAIVTMTTVGYGDLVPQTLQGKIVGSLCAISGVVLIAITIPVLVNNFLLFYGYAKVIEARRKEDKVKEVKEKWQHTAQEALYRPRSGVNRVHVQPVTHLKDVLAASVINDKKHATVNEKF